MALELRPTTCRAAQAIVKQLHRKLPRVEGGTAGTTVFVNGELVGVGIASLPKAPASRDGYTIEITRVATDGHPNACSRLYGALCRSCAALGYRRAITFTQLGEPGTSLRAAGFTDDGLTREQCWDRPNNPRSKEKSQVRRWVRLLQEPRKGRVMSRRAEPAPGETVREA